MLKMSEIDLNISVGGPLFVSHDWAGLKSQSSACRHEQRGIKPSASGCNKQLKVDLSMVL